MYSYYQIYKPYNVLSQFTPEHGNESLADYFSIEKDVYPVGRLDKDSEGLLLLTNDKSINSNILSPKNHISKTYWVQVDGVITKAAIENLKLGVEIKVKKKTHFTLPAEVEEINSPVLPERNPPVRYRKNIPTSWISIKINEGKNRQIRRMTAAVGFPTLRLVRVAIGKLKMTNFEPGNIEKVSKKVIQTKILKSD